MVCRHASSIVGVFSRDTLFRCPSLLLHLRQRRFGLGQPEGHIHSTVELDGGRECSAGLLWLAALGIQRAQAEVAVRLERAHAQLFGERYGLLVGGCGWFDLRGIAMCGDLAEQSQTPRLMALLLVVTGGCQGALGKLVRLLLAAGQERRFTEMGDPERIRAYGSRDIQLYGLDKQWLGLGETAGQRISIAQRPSSQLERERHVRGLADFQAFFEPGNGLGEVPLAQVETADANIRITQGEGLLDCLGDPHCLCPMDAPLGELSQLGQAPDEPDTADRGRQAGVAEALVEPLADEGLGILPVAMDRLPIVASKVVIDAQVEGRHHL